MMQEKVKQEHTNVENNTKKQQKMDKKVKG